MAASICLVAETLKNKGRKAEVFDSLTLPLLISQFLVLEVLGAASCLGFKTTELSAASPQPSFPGSGSGTPRGRGCRWEASSKVPRK